MSGVKLYKNMLMLIKLLWNEVIVSVLMASRDIHTRRHNRKQE